jgi:hypothetical protein
MVAHQNREGRFGCHGFGRRAGRFKRQEEVPVFIEQIPRLKTILGQRFDSDDGEPLPNAYQKAAREFHHDASGCDARMMLKAVAQLGEIHRQNVPPQPHAGQSPDLIG